MAAPPPPSVLTGEQILACNTSVPEPPWIATGQNVFTAGQSGFEQLGNPYMMDVCCNAERVGQYYNAPSSKAPRKTVQIGDCRWTYCNVTDAQALRTFQDCFTADYQSYSGGVFAVFQGKGGDEKPSAGDDKDDDDKDDDDAPPTPNTGLALNPGHNGHNSTNSTTSTTSTTSSRTSSTSSSSRTSSSTSSSASSSSSASDAAPTQDPDGDEIPSAGQRSVSAPGVSKAGLATIALLFAGVGAGVFGL